jgi:hypothetical protein
MGKWAPALGWAALVALASACGHDTACDEAVAKLVDECELGSGASVSGGTAECKDLVECDSECVVENDCEDITDPVQDQNNPYTRCLGDCRANP